MKASNIEFHQNPSSGGRGHTCGQTDKQRETESKTDRHDEAVRRFLGLCEHV